MIVGNAMEATICLHARRQVLAFAKADNGSVTKLGCAKGGGGVAESYRQQAKTHESISKTGVVHVRGSALTPRSLSAGG